MEALLVKFDILNLSTYQLPEIPAPSHYTAVPKLVMEWAQASSLMDQNQESNQIWHHSLPILGDGSSSSEVWYTQLPRFYLKKITAPSHYTVVPRLVMEWAQVSSLMDQNQEINQIWHHSLPMLSDGSTSSEVWYTQPLQIPITKNNTTKPLLCSSYTPEGMYTR